ncbi:MAG: UvrD-helicase domain-containing protein, partial [Steroidobacteraceae bacterium]
MIEGAGGIALEAAAETAAAVASAADTAARALALDPGRSVLLEAPAGSGKTTVLTQRLLALLATVEEPEAILAITFTRKAAAEMRDRVVRALRGEIDADGAHGRKLRELAEVVNARSRRLGWSLEAHSSRLRIQTIDSLNRWLASQRPLAARGAAELEIAQSPLRLYRMAARQTLLDAQGDTALEADAGLLFERLDNDFGRFERLLAEMLARRAHWLPRLLAEESLAERVESSLRAIVGERLRRAQALIPRTLVAQGARLAHEAARRREAALDGRPGPWRIWLQAPRSGAPLALGHWQGLAQLALTAAQTWRLTLTQREGFPKEERDAKRAASEWIAQLSGIAGARELLAELANLPMPQISADDALALAALARVL